MYVNFLFFNILTVLAGSPGASGGKYYDEMDFNKKVYPGTLFTFWYAF